MMKRLATYIFSALAVMAASCTGDETPMVNLGIDDAYVITRMKSLHLSPALTGSEYRWTMHREGRDSAVSSQHDFVFVAADTGTYRLSFEIADDETPFRHDFTVKVVHEEVEYSPYITDVYQYRPAPGQFVNLMPQYEEGDSEADMLRKAEENISGTNDVMITLGGYGGYVVFGFDHTVVNRPGKKDFKVLGNAFYSEFDEYREKQGGSCEPGIVMVSLDVNQNGKPDDEWYELAGSEYYKPETIKNYSITYSRPAEGHKPVPDMSNSVNDAQYIGWTDSEGTSGYIEHNVFHAQDYFPQWLHDDRLNFSGTRLKQNGRDESGIGMYYVLYSYPWGYADNHPNQYDDLTSFDISWAVDRNGRPVHLPGADFIKVYTAVNQQMGKIGETSTEIIRARDLHVDAGSETLPDIEDIEGQYAAAVSQMRLQ